MKKIGIIGFGWLGSRLAASMSGPYQIYTTATTKDKVEDLSLKGFHASLASFPDFQLEEKIAQWNEIKDIDVLIITIPLSGKRCCASSLYNRVQHLLSFIGDFDGQMFVMSSTGVYPDIAGEYSEESLSSDEVQGERMVRNRYPQVNILRLSGLMGDNRLLKNYNVSNLQAPVNHIHYEDISGIIEKMIKIGSKGKLYNVTAPQHPSKAEVINAQKNLPSPDQSVGEGKIILPSKLVSELDFVFKYPDPKAFH
ncbi:hypothetical protein B0A69_12175 [Chryseobacterium shigense]|uniref:Nucleoside-diphosphate-sugar epimerase n=1 Tax=Chryseobacterium shigense TaxID=297244 RepID=A0A1N7JQB1_9FLAO|nr:hypothetical protein [Chryseobacterium shigense]PQA92923.1 hypothetical protein B0A69_12175 [Chryseobacterium shigense]SIS51505.1 hypothetical protein SAMN05421639_107101 [Chryseobacterium shigense]